MRSEESSELQIAMTTAGSAGTGIAARIVAAVSGESVVPRGSWVHYNTV